MIKHKENISSNSCHSTITFNIYMKFILFVKTLSYIILFHNIIQLKYGYLGIQTVIIPPCPCLFSSVLLLYQYNTLMPFYLISLSFGMNIWISNVTLLCQEPLAYQLYCQMYLAMFNIWMFCHLLPPLAIRLRTPISTKQTQLCTRSNLKIVRQQRTTGDYYASRR